MTAITELKPFRSHDHQHCLDEAIRQAEQRCRSRGERFTRLRKQILEMIWSSHEPVKAYDLLDRLKAVHPGSAPPTVYRALDFLLDAGLIHRIESLNAFLGCGVPGSGHSGQFLICRRCGSVAELNDDRAINELHDMAGALKFRVDNMVIEIYGTCERCLQESR